MTESLYDTVLSNMKRLGIVDQDFQGSKIQPQKRPTSKPLSFMRAEPVMILVDAPAHVVHTKQGVPAKRQPKPWKPGDTVYARLRGDGTVALYPFSLAGSGYEIIEDAEEGVHYRFI